MFERIKRLEVGVLLALGMGIIYALVSQTINRVILKDIPLYTGLPSAGWMVALIIAASTLLGFLACLPNQMLFGGLLAGVAGGCLMFIKHAYVTPTVVGSFLPFVSALLSVFLPYTILFFGIALFLRWIIHRLLEDYFIINQLSLNRFLIVFLLLLLAAILGGFSLKNREFRTDLRLVNAQLLEASEAPSISLLPESLQKVPGYYVYRTEPYQLEPSNDTDLFLGETPQGVLERDKGIVRVYYPDGFTLTCLTIDETDQVICEAYNPPITP